MLSNGDPFAPRANVPGKRLGALNWVQFFLQEHSVNLSHFAWRNARVQSPKRYDYHHFTSFSVSPVLLVIAPLLGALEAAENSERSKPKQRTSGSRLVPLVCGYHTFDCVEELAVGLNDESSIILKDG